MTEILRCELKIMTVAPFLAMPRVNIYMMHDEAYITVLLAYHFCESLYLRKKKADLLNQDYRLVSLY